MAFADGLVWLMTVYAACGIIFAIPFLIFGVGRIDPQAHGASVTFRLIILPAVAALWPLLLRRWAGDAR